MKDKFPQIEELDKNQLLALEKDLLGFYLTENPLNAALTILKDMVSHKLEEIVSELAGQKVKIGGIITSVRHVFTKRNNDEMVFVTIGNERGSKIDLVVFPKIYSRTKNIWIVDRVVIVAGRVDFREEKNSIIVEEASLVEMSFE